MQSQLAKGVSAAEQGWHLTDLEKFSRALRLRWIWFQWMNPEKPWNGSPIPIDATDEVLFALATTVTVHSGTKAKFCQSSWVNGCSPSAMFPELFKHSKQKNRSVADALLNDNRISDVAHDLSPALMAQYIMLWILIDAVQFDREDTAEDAIVWRMTADGAYSARSAYALQFEGSKLSAFPSMVWKIRAPARCKFFMWLMLQNRIWTAGRLLLRECPNEYFCPLHNKNLEMASHLFQECPLSQQIWIELSNWAKVPGFHPSTWRSNSVLEDWFSKLTSGANPSKAKAKGI
jgi:hypothetical protein